LSAFMQRSRQIAEITQANSLQVTSDQIIVQSKSQINSVTDKENQQSHDEEKKGGGMEKK
jgi:hypothetical protein